MESCSDGETNMENSETSQIHFNSSDKDLVSENMVNTDNMEVEDESKTLDNPHENAMAALQGKKEEDFEIENLDKKDIREGTDTSMKTLQLNAKENVPSELNESREKMKVFDGNVKNDAGITSLEKIGFRSASTQTFAKVGF